MGRLIAKRYRTKLMSYLADHTYVECGAGRAWGCWGGKTGGKFLASGVGSTARANKIANLDERAGVTRYLIDGVCHQAANRILAPAGILVSAAHGYRLSQSIFGTYGRSSFDMHASVEGELEKCIETAYKNELESDGLELTMNPRDISLLRSNRAYVAHYEKFPKTTSLESLNNNVHRFELDMRILSDGKLSIISSLGLVRAKKLVEMELHDMEKALVEKFVKPAEFVRAFDKLSDLFQDEAANALSKREYNKIFEVDRDERIRLTDPEAVDKAFGPGTFERADSPPPM